MFVTETLDENFSHFKFFFTEEFQNEILTKIFHNENFKTEIKANENLANYGTLHTAHR